LGFLPTLSRELAPPKEWKIPPDFILASDRSALPPWQPGSGGESYQPDSYPVLVPVAHRLLEAIMRLYARHSGVTHLGSYFWTMIVFMQRWVDEAGRLNVEQLAEPCRTFYKERKAGADQEPRWTKELKRALGEPV
jgi:hypothetical protein